MIIDNVMVPMRTHARLVILNGQVYFRGVYAYAIVKISKIYDIGFRHSIWGEIKVANHHQSKIVFITTFWWHDLKGLNDADNSAH